MVNDFEFGTFVCVCTISGVTVDVGADFMRPVSLTRPTKHFGRVIYANIDNVLGHHYIVPVTVSRY